MLFKAHVAILYD